MLVLRTSYWATSGLYPQQFILSFPKKVSAIAIRMRSYFVRTMSIERSPADKPENFQYMAEKELQLTDAQHQVVTLYEGQFVACHLRFTIKSGYDHICAIYKIEIKGEESGSNSSDLNVDMENEIQHESEHRQWNVKSDLTDDTTQQAQKSITLTSQYSNTQHSPLQKEQFPEHYQVAKVISSDEYTTSPVLFPNILSTLENQEDRTQLSPFTSEPGDTNPASLSSNSEITTQPLPAKNPKIFKNTMSHTPENMFAEADDVSSDEGF